MLRPGRQAVLSDMHPIATMTGSIAGFPGPDITRGIPYVPNLTASTSATTSACSLDVGLVITECLEPPVTEEVLQSFPSTRRLARRERAKPSSIRRTYSIWRLRRPTELSSRQRG